MNNTEKAKAIIEQIQYITLATVSKEDEPWNTPVYSAYDDDWNFYWMSWQENQHSQNIRDNGKVFIVVYDSTAPEGTGEGVYIKATAEEITDRAEAERALGYLYQRINQTPPSVDEFLDDYPRRIYKAVPQQCWINEDGDVNGNVIDVRTEVRL